MCRGVGLSSTQHYKLLCRPRRPQQGREGIRYSAVPCYSPGMRVKPTPQPQSSFPTQTPTQIPTPQPHHFKPRHPSPALHHCIAHGTSHTLSSSHLQHHLAPCVPCLNLLVCGCHLGQREHLQRQPSTHTHTCSCEHTYRSAAGSLLTAVHQHHAPAGGS
jgi:hypothetical protein